MKQHHVWLTSRNRRRTSFTGDHTFAAARTEFLRSKWYSTRPRAWNCGFDSRRDAGKPASHSSFTFLRKKHLLRQRGWGYSGNQWVQLPSSWQQGEAPAAFLLRFLFQNLFAAVKTGFLRSKHKLKCGCPEWGSAKAGSGFDSRRSQLEPVCYSPRFFSSASRTCSADSFWGSQIRDTSTHNRLVAGSSPAVCLRAFVAQW